MSTHLIVVGAGIVGTCVADAAVSAGLQVTVIERGTVGGGATGAGMGHLVVMDDSPAQLALTHWSCRLWEELLSGLTASGVEYARCGTLWIAADLEELAEAERKSVLLREAGIETQLLDGAQLARLEPNLRPGLSGALLVAGDGVVYPPQIAAALLERAVENGATMLRAEVRSIAEGAVALADGREVRADVIVDATGQWTVDLDADRPVRPRKGHLVITERTPGFVRHQLVELGYLKSAHSSELDSVAFNVQPRATGQVLIGSSRQFDSGPDVDWTILRRMLARAVEYMPALENLQTTRVWTGHRAATPDKLPLIGPTEDPRVWLATGHEGLGITTAPATARLLVDALQGRAGEIPIDPYLPTRFPAPANHV